MKFFNNEGNLKQKECCPIITVEELSEIHEQARIRDFLRVIDTIKFIVKEIAQWIVCFIIAAFIFCAIMSGLSRGNTIPRDVLTPDAVTTIEAGE